MHFVFPSDSYYFLRNVKSTATQFLASAPHLNHYQWAILSFPTLQARWGKAYSSNPFPPVWFLPFSHRDVVGCCIPCSSQSVTQDGSTLPFSMQPSQQLCLDEMLLVCGHNKSVHTHTVTWDVSGSRASLRSWHLTWGTDKPIASALCSSLTAPSQGCCYHQDIPLQESLLHTLLFQKNTNTETIQTNL